MAWVTEITEDQLQFRFPQGWKATQFDRWSFYRNQFHAICGGAKAVDIVALDPENSAWLIEIKDYVMHPRTKTESLEDEIALKVRDTLAALLPAATNANKSSEQTMAKQILRASRIRVVLHLEQPAKHSKLFPRAIDLAHIQQKLRFLLKAIDPHSKVIETSELSNITWEVQRVRQAT